MAGVKGRRNTRRGRGGRGGGRGRGRGRASQETHQNSSHHRDQDYPYSPPLPSRSPSRQPGAVLVQFPNFSTSLRSSLRRMNKTPSHYSSLIPAIRILNEPRSRDIGMPELQQFTSKATGEDVGVENAAEDVEMSVSTGSPSCSGPLSKRRQDQDNLGTKLTSQEAQQVDPQPSSHDYQPSRENDVVLHVEDELEKSTTNFAHRNSQCFSGLNSFNITEFAQMLKDDVEDDPEEVESALDPAYDCVNEHKVKIEFAPLLRAIFERYGDLTRETDFESPRILSILLEHICDIYKKLKETKYRDFTLIDLKEMLVEVRDLEHQKLNVRWLREKLEYIIQTHTDFQNYLSIKEDEVKSDATVRSLENEVSLLRHKLFEAEEKLVVEKAKNDQIKNVGLDIRARVYDLTTHSLVHGLL